MLTPDSGYSWQTLDRSGATDVRTGRSAFTFTQRGEAGHEDIVVDGLRVYSRSPASASGTAVPWCWVSSPSPPPGPGISLTQTLATLAGSDRQVQYINQAVVRGVATTHYRVTGGGRPALEIWTDAEDRLRRLHWTHGADKETDTTDFFDFDAPISITVPTGAPACDQSTATP